MDKLKILGSGKRAKGSPPLPPPVVRQWISNRISYAFEGILQFPEGELIFDTQPEWTSVATALELALQHGLAPKKMIFSGPRTFWDPIESLPSIIPAAALSVAFVKELSLVRSSIGRGRAWLRFCCNNGSLLDLLGAFFRRARSDVGAYQHHAFAMDEGATHHLLSLAAQALGQVKFTLRVDSAELDVMPLLSADEWATPPPPAAAPAPEAPAPAAPVPITRGHSGVFMVEDDSDDDGTPAAAESVGATRDFSSVPPAPRGTKEVAYQPKKAKKGKRRKKVHRASDTLDGVPPGLQSPAPAAASPAVRLIGDGIASSGSGSPNPSPCPSPSPRVATDGVPLASVPVPAAAPSAPRRPSPPASWSLPSAVPVRNPPVAQHAVTTAPEPARHEDGAICATRSPVEEERAGATGGEAETSGEGLGARRAALHSPTASSRRDTPVYIPQAGPEFSPSKVISGKGSTRAGVPEVVTAPAPAPVPASLPPPGDSAVPVEPRSPRRAAEAQAVSVPAAEKTQQQPPTAGTDAGLVARTDAVNSKAARIDAVQRSDAAEPPSASAEGSSASSSPPSTTDEGTGATAALPAVAKRVAAAVDTPAVVQPPADTEIAAPARVAVLPPPAPATDAASPTVDATAPAPASADVVSPTPILAGTTTPATADLPVETAAPIQRGLAPPSPAPAPQPTPSPVIVEPESAARPDSAPSASDSASLASPKSAISSPVTPMGERPVALTSGAPGGVSLVPSHAALPTAPPALHPVAEVSVPSVPSSDAATAQEARASSEPYQKTTTDARPADVVAPVRKWPMWGEASAPSPREASRENGNGDRAASPDDAAKAAPKDTDAPAAVDKAAAATGRSAVSPALDGGDKTPKASEERTTVRRDKGKLESTEFLDEIIDRAKGVTREPPLPPPVREESPPRPPAPSETYAPSDEQIQEMARSSAQKRPVEEPLKEHTSAFASLVSGYAKQRGLEQEGFHGRIDTDRRALPPMLTARELLSTSTPEDSGTDSPRRTVGAGMSPAFRKTTELDVRKMLVTEDFVLCPPPDAESLPPAPARVPTMSFNEFLLVNQNKPKTQRTCSGCSVTMDVSLSRACIYEGGLFCRKCHRDDKYIIPARVVHEFDFSVYPVATHNYEFLVSIVDQPVLDFSLLNPFIYEMCKPMRYLRSLRYQLGKVYDVVKKCRKKAQLLETIKDRMHLAEALEPYSVQDLIDVDRGALVKTLRHLIMRLMKHCMFECEHCRVNSATCEICDDDDSPIFAFQLNTVVTCPACKQMYHAACYDEAKGICPWCARLDAARAAA